MNYEQEREIVEKLKQNWTGFGGLTPDEKEVLKKYKEHVGQITHDGNLCFTGEQKKYYPACIYRVEPNFQLPPKKRWWFNIATKEVCDSLNFWTGVMCIEVTEEYAKYLSAKPEGDWELRFVKNGETYLSINTRKEQTCFDAQELNADCGKSDRGYRWCKIEKKEDWFVAEVHPDGYFTDQNGNPRMVSDRIKGFGGVQFEGQVYVEWYMKKEMLIDDEGELYDIDLGKKNKRPARICRVRIWIGGE